MQGEAAMRQDTDAFWADKVDAFVGVFTQSDVRQLVGNLDTRVERLDTAERPYPITINDFHRDGNCYVVDPVTGYCDYAEEETRNFTEKPLLRSALINLIKAAGPLVRATGLSRAVHVNNWLLSTNPAPSIDPVHACDIRETVLARYPTHAIVIRSLNTHADKQAMQALVSQGFKLLPSRQIYIFNSEKPTPRDSPDLKRDRALMAKTPLHHVSNTTFENADFPRAIELYNMLYLKKYTPLNPHYSAHYLREMHRSKLLHLEGYRDTTGRLVAVGGRFQTGQTLTQPIVGYDTTRPRAEGLYRLINALAQSSAQSDGLVLNMSAGAAGFKRHRRARPAIEYSAVYVNHLGTRQRLATAALKELLSRIGVPLLQRFKL